jgi:lipoate-protein ligase A
MNYLINNREITDSRLNLALEEYCLRNLPQDRDYLLLYINDPAVVVGRHQNVLEEIDDRYVQDKGIQVVRRISGGGAVYHDRGNLNFSFIGRFGHDSLKNVGRCLAPLLAALSKLGVNAETNALNDIVVNGNKISGNAQFSNTRRIVVHGTLLFNADLNILRKALTPLSKHITSRAKKSIRSPVANISDYLKQSITMEQFQQKILEAVTAATGPVKRFDLSTRDWDAVYRLAENKYFQWQWNRGKSPPFKVQKSARFENKELEARIDVKNGLITAVSVNANIATNGMLAELKQRLVGIRYDFKEIENTVSGINLWGRKEITTEAQMVELLY